MTTKQSRSLLKHQALLEAGRRLLDAQDLGRLSVAQLTRDAGMAVGLVYSRFANKEAWFAELLRVTGEKVLDDSAALLAGAVGGARPNGREVALIGRVWSTSTARTAASPAPRISSRRALAAVLGRSCSAFRLAAGRRCRRALYAHVGRVGAGSGAFASARRLRLVYGTLVDAEDAAPAPAR